MGGKILIVEAEFEVQNRSDGTAGRRDEGLSGMATVPQRSHF